MKKLFDFLRKPQTGEIKSEVVDFKELLKLNDPAKSIQVNDVVSGTRITLGNRANSRLAQLKQRIQQMRLDYPVRTTTTKEIQIAALTEIIAVAATSYTYELTNQKKSQYEERLRSRLDNKAIHTLEWAMVGGCGNCMDQNLFTSTLLSEVATELQLRYSAYVAKNAKGENHFFTIVTLLPSQDQYILESSFPGIRLLPLRQASVFNQFTITNVVDQHKPVDRKTEISCRKIHSTASGL